MRPAKNSNFWSMLEKQWRDGKFSSVGLDSDYGRIPDAARKKKVENTIFFFNRSIIEATADLVCAYKPNIAFYECLGAPGISALIKTTSFIKKYAPLVPVILDFKRADIDNTNMRYANAAFQTYRADAVTLNPYLGKEALRPFLNQKNKGIFMLCRTSNIGAGEFQNLKVNGQPLYRVIAKRISKDWNKNKNCGLVIGATRPKEIGEIREIDDNMPFLIPGVGAQGGNIKKAVAAGLNTKKTGIIINASQSIIFASKNSDFAISARKETIRINNLIKYCLDSGR